MVTKNPLRAAAVGRRSCAFTLVELLVVIGIIALLIAILLPSLAAARRSAQRTACAAKLQQMMVAATMHRQDHHDYYPLVGVLPGDTPEGLDDTYTVKYAYQSLAITVANINSGSAKPRILAPITQVLAVYMGYKSAISQTSNTAQVSQMYDSSSYIRLFLCPSQASDFADLARFDPPGPSLEMYCTVDGQTFSEPQSYIYNEAVMGWYDPLNRLRGKGTKVRQPATTMFCADGLHGTLSVESPNVAFYTLYNVSPNAPVTMADAFSGKTTIAGEASCFDKVRHAGKINIAFFDGHVETRNLNAGDLSRVYLLAP